MAGQVLRGRGLLERAWDARHDQPLSTRARLACWLGEAYLREGSVADARAFAESAWDLATSRGERGFQAWARRLRGDVALHDRAGDTDVIEHEYRAALAVAEELGMRPLQAHCHAGLGRLYHRSGHPHAQSERARAFELYRELEMTRWLPS
jgi:hypothetical protein